MKDSLFKLFGQRVEVSAFGIVYRGLFQGADDDWVYLKGDTGWINIPMSEVKSMKAEGACEKDRLHRLVEGEPRKISEEDRREKRRYFLSDRLKVVERPFEEEATEEDQGNES